MPTIIETFTKAQPETVEVEPQLYGLTLTSEPGRGNRNQAQFLPLNEAKDGWLPGINPVKYQWNDNPEAEDESARIDGSLFRAALFSAVLQDNPYVRALEARCGHPLVGLTVKDAGYLLRGMAERSE